MSEPMKGNHNDVYEIDSSMTEIFSTIESAGISVDGIFNNADAGFDCVEFRMVCERHGVIANVSENPRYNHEDVTVCFDDALYKERYVIERSNAWMDSFRTLLLCYDTTASSWKGWNYLAFEVLLLKKITNHKSLNEFEDTFFINAFVSDINSYCCISLVSRILRDTIRTKAMFNRCFHVSLILILLLLRL